MLDKKKAFEIAEQKIKKFQQESNYDDFFPVVFQEETDFFWTFVSGSDAMFNDGYVPGAFFVSVDKADGHIWTRREKENYFIQKSKPELQAA